MKRPEIFRAFFYSFVMRYLPGSFTTGRKGTLKKEKSALSA